MPPRRTRQSFRTDELTRLFREWDGGSFDLTEQQYADEIFAAPRRPEEPLPQGGGPDSGGDSDLDAPPRPRGRPQARGRGGSRAPVYKAPQYRQPKAAPPQIRGTNAISRAAPRAARQAAPQVVVPQVPQVVYAPQAPIQAPAPDTVMAEPPPQAAAPVQDVVMSEPPPAQVQAPAVQIQPPPVQAPPVVPLIAPPAPLPLPVPPPMPPIKQEPAQAIVVQAPVAPPNNLGAVVPGVVKAVPYPAPPLPLPPPQAPPPPPPAPQVPPLQAPPTVQPPRDIRDWQINALQTGQGAMPTERVVVFGDGAPHETLHRQFTYREMELINKGRGVYNHMFSPEEMAEAKARQEPYVMEHSGVTDDEDDAGGAPAGGAPTAQQLQADVEKAQQALNDAKRKRSESKMRGTRTVGEGGAARGGRLATMLEQPIKTQSTVAISKADAAAQRVVKAQKTDEKKHPPPNPDGSQDV